MPHSTELLSREPAAPIMREIEPGALLEQARVEAEQLATVAMNIGPVVMTTELTQAEKNATLREARAELFADTEPKIYLGLAEKMIADMQKPDGHSRYQYDKEFLDNVYNGYRYKAMLELIYGYAAISELGKARELADALAGDEKHYSGARVSKEVRRALSLEIIAKSSGFGTIEESTKAELTELGLADDDFKLYEDWAAEREAGMHSKDGPLGSGYWGVDEGRFIPVNTVDRFVQLGASEVGRVRNEVVRDGRPRTVLNAVRAITEFSIGRQAQLLHEMRHDTQPSVEVGNQVPE